VPVDLVHRLAGQGLSEHEIIAQLRQRGFSASQIDKALSQSIKSVVEQPQSKQTYQPDIHSPENVVGMQRPPGTPEKVVPGPQTKPAVEPVKFSSAEEFSLTPPKDKFTFEEKPQDFLEKPKTPEPSGPEITLEEIIEGIVAERWHDFEKRMAEFENRQTKLESEISEIRTEIKDIIERSRSWGENFATKLDEFGEHVSGIEGRIGSIEKAFKDFLPELTENVRAMAEVVERLKEQR